MYKLQSHKQSGCTRVVFVDGDRIEAGGFLPYEESDAIKADPSLMKECDTSADGITLDEKLADDYTEVYRPEEWRTDATLA